MSISLFSNEPDVLVFHAADIIFEAGSTLLTRSTRVRQDHDPQILRRLADEEKRHIVDASGKPACENIVPRKRRAQLTDRSDEPGREHSQVRNQLSSEKHRDVPGRTRRSKFVCAVSAARVEGHAATQNFRCLVYERVLDDNPLAIVKALDLGHRKDRCFGERRGCHRSILARPASPPSLHPNRVRALWHAHAEARCGGDEAREQVRGRLVAGGEFLRMPLDADHEWPEPGPFDRFHHAI